MSTVRVCAILLFAACMVPLLGLPFVTGPVPGRTGGFGEASCHECHWDNPINQPPGRLTLSGAPATYTAGTRYPIIVDLVHPELLLGGFQISARIDGGPRAGLNAGTLQPVDDFTEGKTDEKQVVYLQHTKAGATPAKPGAARWTVEWTAPAGDAPVIFHAAGNASNGDASPLGDYVYTTSVSSRPEIGSGK
jgi:hypothetical protein